MHHLRKTHWLFLTVFCMSTFTTLCQVVNIDWAIPFAASGYEQSYDIIITADTNLLIVGYASPLPGVFSDCGENGGFIAVKLDTMGNIIWSRCYGGSEGAVANAVINTNDGGFILVGETYSSDGDVTGAHGNADCWVVKLGAEGNLEWEHAFGGSDFDSGEDIIELSDGGYAVVVRTSSTDGDVIGHHGVGYNYDAWVFTLNAEGEIYWSKCFGGSDNEYGFGIIQDADNNLVIAGGSYSLSGDVPENKGSSDVWVFKVNTDGVLIWSETYGGSETDNANKIANTNNGYFVVGETYSNDFDVIGNHGSQDSWLLKLDTNGSILMQKCFGGTSADEIFAIDYFGVNELILAGLSGSSNGDLSGHYGPSYYADFWTLSTDTLGNINWQKNLGGTLNDFAYGIIKLSSSTYVATGFTFSSDYDVTENAGYADIWTVKLSVCNTVFYSDTDGDGFGDPLIDSIACTAPLGYVSDSTDCNDADNTFFPTALDVCNGLDDNCNGLTDEDAVFITWYTDADMDGYGDPATDSVSCYAIADFVTNNLDCNDMDASISPDAPEVCNAVDDNCNGIADDGLITYTLFADTDSDDYGNPDAAIDTCLETIPGYVTNGLDCNDTLNTIYLGAEEVCNYLDDDCDGLTDDNLIYTWQYEDADGDLYGNMANDTLACLEIPGYVIDSTDCNDTDPNMYPGAMELLNGLDDDCDGISDEGLNLTEHPGSTITLYPNPNTGTFTLAHPDCSQATYSITDITGKQIMSGQCTGTQTPVALPKVAAGLYTCRWVCSDGTREQIGVIKFEVTGE